MIICKRLAPSDDQQQHQQQQPGDGGLTRVTGVPGVTGQKEGKEEKKKEKKFLRGEGRTVDQPEIVREALTDLKRSFLQQNTCQNIHTRPAWLGFMTQHQLCVLVLTSDHDRPIFEPQWRR